MTPSPPKPGSPDDQEIASSPPSVAPADRLDSARDWALLAERGPGSASQAWLHCAVEAFRAIDTDDDALSDAAVRLATRAADEVLARVVQRVDDWSPGPLDAGEVRLLIEFRGISPQLRPPLRVRRAGDVPMDAFGGQRFGCGGLGVPLAALSSAWREPPLDRLTPHSGVFRNLTAWIEPDPARLDGTPRLVLADPRNIEGAVAGARRIELARDTSAAYAWAMDMSKFERLGLWGLIGGKQIARRAGVYPLEDYDPARRPLVMIHGLGSNPLIWSHLSNAVWGAEDLRERFQVWQVVYQTDAPLLAARLRVQEYLDEAWRALDPDGGGRARANAVLVGHSMGGVVARLLCADSGNALWDAAFVVPPESLDASAQDVEVVTRIFRFYPYPGVARAIFLAAPHRGSPSAGTVLGRLTSDLVGRRAVEVHALRRIAKANPSAIRPDMRELFQDGWINSITTLRSEQPVRRAAEALLPSPAIPYHTIAGVRPGDGAATDGVVPLDSAMIPGAQSSLVVASGHRVHENPQAIAEVLRILRT